MNNDHFWNIVIRLETDYQDYGGKIPRWEHPEETYLDCSTCKHFNKIDNDWGICTNPLAKRAGMLTFEHQAGYDCSKS